jgi:hypothetical protein
VVLMITGIALFGYLAGSLASFFVEHQEEDATNPELADIAQRLERIEQLLSTSEGGPTRDSQSSE